MARGRGSGGPKAGTLVTAMVVASARKGVVVEVGGVELLLPRARWGAAVDRLDDAGYGMAVTLEVVGAAPGSPPVLSRIGVERSIRQPRTIEGCYRAAGGGRFEPADGSTPFSAHVLDRLDGDVAALEGQARRWEVGAPLLGVRLIAPVDEGA